jgi:integrase
MTMAKRSGRRTAGDGALFQRANGLWVATIDLGIIDGKRVRWSGSSMTKERALAKLREARAEHEATGTVGKRSQTVGDWLDHWLEHIVRPTKRPKTYAEYERCVRLHLKPRLGRDRLHTLTPQRIRMVERAIADEHTAATANNVHRCLRTALSAAVSDGLVARNAAEAVTPPTAGESSRGALTVEQATSLLAATSKTPLGSRWAFALLTGTRQGEALGLEWDRVDLTAGTADISWQLQRIAWDHGCGPKVSGEWPCGRKRGGWCPSKHRVLPDGYELRELQGSSLVLTRPKTTRSVRLLPLPPQLVASLKRHRSRDISPGLVWRDGSKPIDPKDDYAAWQSALKTASLPAVPLHSTRHTTATLLLAQRVDPKIIQAIMGHTRAATTQAYQHVDLTMAREALDGLGAALG